MSYLGGAKYGDLILKEHPEGWGATFFTQKELFGDPKPLIDKLCATGRCPVIKLNLAWKDDHKFSRADFPKIAREADRFKDLIQKYKNIKFYVCGATEHTLNAEDANNLRLLIGSRILSAEYINNPWEGKGAFLLGCTNEIHGVKANKPKIGESYSFDFDGSNCVDANVEAIKAKFADAELFAFWHPAFNGRLTSNDKTPRPQRKAWPNSALIDSIIALHKPNGVNGKMPKGYLWKSHADRHETPPEPRAYKPVLIMPPKSRRVELITENGQVVAAGSAPAPFADGRFRYYFADYGYLIAEKAKRIQGHGVVTLRVDGKAICKINPAFRSGDFRE